MILLGKECRRMFADRGLWGILVVCVLLELVIILFSESLQSLPPSGYRAMSEYVLDVEPELRQAYLSQEMQKVQTLFMLQYQDNADMEMEYEIEDAALYPRYCQNLYMECLLYEMVLREVDQIDTYQNYLEKLQEQNRPHMGILSESVFEARRRERVSVDYAGCGDISLGYVRSYGISKGLQFFPAHVLALLMAMALAVRLYLKDREKGFYRLFDTMPFGGFRLRLVRSLVIFTGILFSTGVLLMESLLLYGWLYGMPASGFWNAPVQSFYGAQSATLRISIGQMLILSYVLLCTACFLASQLVAVMSRWILQMNTLFGGWFLVLLAEMLLYFGINPYGRWAVWKWVNLAALLNPQYGILNYKLLNVFRYPVGYFGASTAVLLIAVILCTGLNCLLSVEREKEASERRKTGRWSSGRLHLHRSLFVHELRKLFVDSLGVVMLLAAAAGALWILNSYEESPGNLEELYYRRYIAMMEGVYTEETRELLDQKWEEIEQEAYAVSWSNRYIVDAKQAAMLRCMEYARYLEERPGSSVVYEKGYEQLFRNKTRSLLYMFISMTMVILVTAFFWGMERTGRMYMLQAVSAAGEKTVHRIKRMQGLFLTVLLYGCVYGAYFAGVFRAYGRIEMYAQARSLMSLADLPAWVSIGSFLMVVFAIRLFMLFVLTEIIRILSQRMNSVVEVILGAEAVAVLGLLLLYMLV